MNAPQAIDAFVSAAAATLSALNVPIASRFARNLSDLPGNSVAGTAARVPACCHLDQDCLVGAAVPDATALNDAIAEAQVHMCWRQSCRPDAPDLYNDNHAFVEVVGPDGHLAADNIRFGLFILGPGVYYPPHVHEAEEFYLILAGTAEWQQDDDAYRPVPPGQVVHNASMQPHAMRVRNEPLIVLWGWCGDIGWARYRFV
ncbi:MAG: cupin domain-containing protein [Gammaproteobacteria bacterium]|nr:cupin domain-containing protein [Gammaproteobacteria bacterium]